MNERGRDMNKYEDLVRCPICNHTAEEYYDKETRLFELYCPMQKLFPPHVIKVFDTDSIRVCEKWNRVGTKKVVGEHERK